MITGKMEKHSTSFFQKQSSMPLHPMIASPELDATMKLETLASCIGDAMLEGFCEGARVQRKHSSVLGEGTIIKVENDHVKCKWDYKNRPQPFVVRWDTNNGAALCIEYNDEQLLLTGEYEKVETEC